MELSEEVAKDLRSVLIDTWFVIPNWKWLALVALFSLGFIIHKGGRWFIEKILRRLEKRFESGQIAKLLFQRPIHRPLAALLAGAILAGGIEELHLPSLLAKTLNLPVKLFIGYNGIFLAYLAAEAFGNLLELIAKKSDNQLDDYLAPMLTKVLKVLAIVFGVLIVLQNFGFNVMSILAGLGLGGLALALAAQDTAANLFGSIMIILDQPFKIGDWIKVIDTEGIVEEIGLRSTRIRTAGNSLITIPNAVMAKEKIDNMGLRHVRRCRHNIGVTYNTSEANLRQFMEQIRYLLTQHPQVQKNDVTVTFNQFGDSSLNVLVNFFISTPDPADEFKIQEEILIEIMKIAEKLKVEFAFPTRTVHLASMPVGTLANPGL